MMKLASLVAITLASCAPSAQKPPVQSMAAKKSVVEIADIAPLSGDVGTIDGLIRAYYAAVNVAPDAPRQWDRDKTLYSPWIRFVGLYQEGHFSIYSHQELVDSTEPMIQGGFSEREIHRIVRQYGNMAHVDSTYEGITGGPGGKRFRGVNSLELYLDGDRWWIASVIWQAETSEYPIPADLMPTAQIGNAHQH